MMRRLRIAWWLCSYRWLSRQRHSTKRGFTCRLTDTQRYNEDPAKDTVSMLNTKSKMFAMRTVSRISIFPLSFLPNMPFFSRGSSSRPGIARPTAFPYNKLGARQLRMLRYASDSTPNDIRLTLTTVNRDTRPEYTALSYV